MGDLARAAPVSRPIRVAYAAARDPALLSRSRSRSSPRNANQRRPPGVRNGHRYADRPVALTSLLLSSDAGDAAL
jgi:hypothetical protein